jgi:hypothetical protein
VAAEADLVLILLICRDATIGVGDRQLTKAPTKLGTGLFISLNLYPSSDLYSISIVACGKSR